MMIGIQAAFAIFLSALISSVLVWLTGKLVQIDAYVLGGCVLAGLATGVVIWAKVLFKTKLFDYFFINVKENYEIILGNQLRYDKIPDDPAHRLKLESFPRRSLRPVGQGVRGKFPWELPVTAVNLQSEIVMSTQKDGRPVTCYTQDNVQLEIHYQINLTPLVGYTVNLARKNEEAVKAYFRGRFEMELTAKIRTMSEKDVFAKLPDLKSWFTGLYGGSMRVDKEEKEWGVFTNEPMLISIKRNDRYQQVAEGQLVAQKIQDMVSTINAGYGSERKPDPNLVLMAAARATGNEVSGVLLIPDIGAPGSNEKSTKQRAQDILSSVESIARVANVRPSGSKPSK